MVYYDVILKMDEKSEKQLIEIYKNEGTMRTQVQAIRASSSKNGSEVRFTNLETGRIVMRYFNPN